MLQACVAGKQLVTTSADPAELKGTYTLLLYGCRYPDDIKNLAILVDEGSKYPVEIYDLPTSYQVKKGLPGPQALKEADSFVRCSVRRVTETQLRRITDDAGGTIGYEVKAPLFLAGIREARCPARFLLPAEGRDRQDLYQTGPGSGADIGIPGSDHHDSPDPH